MITHYYFTPDIGISIEAPKIYSNYFNDEYWFAKKNQKGSIAVMVRVVDKMPQLKNTKQVVLRSIHFKRLFWFEYAVDFSQSPILIYVKRHWIERIYFKALGPFIQTNIIEPILYYVALTKKHYLLHASTVEREGTAYCFAGRGGAGKTTTALNKCIKENYSFMGDDLVFINLKNKKAYAFPRPLHLFAYNMFKIPYPSFFKDRVLFWKLWLIIQVKNVVRFVVFVLTREQPLISTRVDVRDLYSNLHLATEATGVELSTIGLNREKLAEEIQDASDLRKDLIAIFSQTSFYTYFVKLEQESIAALVKRL